MNCQFFLAIQSDQGSTNFSAVMKEDYTGSYKCVAENNARDASGNPLHDEKTLTVEMLSKI